MTDRSVAAESFAAALSLLRRQGVSPPERVPPLAYKSPQRVPVALPGVRTGGTAAGPLADALRAQQAGTVSSHELVAAALLAIRRRDWELSAMVEVKATEALAEAAAADAERAAGSWRGHLHGIPITVKDVIDVAGCTTRAGSLAYKRYADEDAASVALLRAAGAIVIGKASTHEFALGVTTPQSRNPYDVTRIPGGSSGGSAISVATGMALASLGTDTRASIRVPAALCGVVGVKATHGAIPTAGIVSLSWTMDHVAPIAATVGDAALVLGVLLAGREDLAALGPATGLKVGVPSAGFDNVDQGLVSAVERALDGLRDQGNSVVRVDRPDGDDFDLAGAAGLVVSRCEAAALHRALDLDRFAYTDEVSDQLAAADSVLAVDYLDAQRVRGHLAERLLACFDGADVLAMPTTATVAPAVADAGRHLMSLARNSIPWSFVGFPAMSVPIGEVGGLPVGMQLVAAPNQEHVLIRAGLAVEAAVRSFAAPSRQS